MPMVMKYAPIISAVTRFIFSQAYATDWKEVGASSVSKLEPLLCFCARVPHEAASPSSLGGASLGCLGLVPLL